MNPQQLIIQVATGYIASTALYLAARLDIASRLAGGSDNGSPSSPPPPAPAKICACTGCYAATDLSPRRLCAESAPGQVDGGRAASRL